MKIAVCVKQAIDTEAVITLDADGQVVTEGAALIIDPYAEFAVEKAVQLKEAHGGEVVVVTIGTQDEVPAIRHALSMGADRAILVEDAAIDTTNPQAKARVLTAVLKEEQPDIIMGGYKSGDTSQAQTLPRVATIMGVPQVGWITGLELEGDSALASHELDDGVEQVSVALPALFTAQQGLAEPRYPTVRDIMQSKKKPIDTKDLAALGIDAAQVGPVVAQVCVKSYALKPEREGGRVIEGDAPDAVAETTNLLATEAKVLSAQEETMANIWVFAEYKDGKVGKVTYEAVSEARRLADAQGNAVSVVVFGSGIDDASLAPLATYGADQVLVVDDPALAEYTVDAYASALESLIDAHQPGLIMFVASSTGQDIAPVIAEKKGAGLISEIVAIEDEGAEPTYVRAPYSGKILEKCAFLNNDELNIVTLRPKAFTIAEPDEGRTATIVRESAGDFGNLRQIVKDVLRVASDRVDLRDAEFIVSGGRGVKGPEGFDVIAQLADELGAAVGASRVAVEQGWIDKQYQVGQTGKIVAPQLYIACGISGSIQHQAGMGQSQCIVAINNDPEADIFRIADYGIVANLFEAVPLMVEEVKKLKG